MEMCQLNRHGIIDQIKLREFRTGIPIAIVKGNKEILKMNTAQRLSYYNQEILKNMSVVESLKGNGLFHEHYPEIEQNFWKYHDRKDLSGLLSIHNKLTKLIDHIREVQQ